jgi:hypothetical protein
LEKGVAGLPDGVFAVAVFPLKTKKPFRADLFLRYLIRLDDKRKILNF